MSTRTPGPWYEGRQAGRSKHGQEMIASEANGKTVAVVYDADADAAFIVEACNAHDALTAENAALRKALTRMVNAYQDEITRANNDVPLTSAALYQARSALAKGGAE